jgi:hypothetical protein
MIINPESATITPIIEYFMFRLAVEIVSSSPAETRYWIPEITKAMMPKNPRIPRIQFIKVRRTSATVASERPVSVGTQTPETIE